MTARDALHEGRDEMKVAPPSHYCSTPMPHLLPNSRFWAPAQPQSPAHLRCDSAPVKTGKEAVYIHMSLYSIPGPPGKLLCSYLHAHSPYCVTNDCLLRSPFSTFINKLGIINVLYGIWKYNKDFLSTEASKTGTFENRGLNFHIQIIVTINLYVNRWIY